MNEIHPMVAYLQRLREQQSLARTLMELGDQLSLRSPDRTPDFLVAMDTYRSLLKQEENVLYEIGRARWQRYMDRFEHQEAASTAVATHSGEAAGEVQADPICADLRRTIEERAAAIADLERLVRSREDTP